MKKKIDVDEEEAPDPFRKLKKQSGFMKQLSDLAQHTPEPTAPIPEPTFEENERQVDSRRYFSHAHRSP